MHYLKMDLRFWKTKLARSKCYIVINGRGEELCFGKLKQKPHLTTKLAEIRGPGTSTGNTDISYTYGTLGGPEQTIEVLYQSGFARGRGTHDRRAGAILNNQADIL
jgi:hypothetical protein